MASMGELVVLLLMCAIQALGKLSLQGPDPTPVLGSLCYSPPSASHFPLHGDSLHNVSGIFRTDRRDVILIAARNSVLRLHLPTNRVTPIPIGGGACDNPLSRTDPDSYCNAYVQQILPISGRTYACVSYNFAGLLYMYSANESSLVRGAAGRGVGQVWPPRQLCTYEPDKSFTAVNVADKELYTVEILNKYLKLKLFKPSSPTQSAECRRAPISALIGSFLSSFTPLILTREQIRLDDSSLASVNRLSAICDESSGGSREGGLRLESTDLHCSIQPKPDVKTFPFPSLRHFAFDPARKALFTVFTTDTGSAIPGSAICVFPARAVQPSCHSSRDVITAPGDVITAPGDVITARETPVFMLTRQDYLLERIVSEYDMERGLHLLFVSTSSGALLKLLFSPETSTTRLLLQMHPAGCEGGIQDMQIVGQFLVVTTGSDVIKLPKHDCAAYSCSACIANKDPFCAWTGHNCSLAPGPAADPAPGPASCPIISRDDSSRPPSGVPEERSARGRDPLLTRHVFGYVVRYRAAHVRDVVRFGLQVASSCFLSGVVFGILSLYGFTQLRAKFENDVYMYSRRAPSASSIRHRAQTPSPRPQVPHDRILSTAQVISYSRNPSTVETSLPASRHNSELTSRHNSDSPQYSYIPGSDHDDSNYADPDCVFLPQTMQMPPGVHTGATPGSSQPIAIPHSASPVSMMQAMPSGSPQGHYLNSGSPPVAHPGPSQPVTLIPGHSLAPGHAGSPPPGKPLPPVRRQSKQRNVSVSSTTSQRSDSFPMRSFQQ